MALANLANGPSPIKGRAPSWSGELFLSPSFVVLTKLRIAFGGTEGTKSEKSMAGHVRVLSVT